MAFKAYLITQEDNKTKSGFVTMDETQLDPGEVTIAVTHSCINYKDALAATGAGRIIRRFPCIGGIDLAGRVAASSDPRFKAGDEVLATSYDIGVAHHGGYAERARVPAAWVHMLPAGLSRAEAMALGTAGFTAGFGIVRMEEIGPEAGKRSGHRQWRHRRRRKPRGRYPCRARVSRRGTDRQSKRNGLFEGTWRQ